MYRLLMLHLGITTVNSVFPHGTALSAAEHIGLRVDYVVVSARASGCCGANSGQSFALYSPEPEREASTHLHQSYSGY
jgi:hypothetical protein